MASDGSVYVADTGNVQIQKFTSDGVFVGKWGKYGVRSSSPGDGEFNYPTAVAVATDGLIYVVDSENHVIQKFFEAP